MPNADDALIAAAVECDVHRVREDLGPNDALRIREYLKVCGIKKPAPWCAAFVAFCYVVKAGFDRMKLPAGLASTCAWFYWAKKKNLLTDDVSIARRGDLFVWCNAKKWQGHIGFICETYRSPVLGIWMIRTIEGNGSNSGSREGTRIVRKGRQDRPKPIGWRRWRKDMRVIRMTAYHE